MKFQVGEFVSLLHETGSYRIISIDGNKAIIADEHGFSYQVTTNSLVKRSPINSPIVNKENQSTPSRPITPRNPQLPTLDLHASSLGIEHLPPNQLLEQQLAQCRTFLNQCLDKHQPKALIIHGVGEGILKHAVRQLLMGKKGIQFHDGNYSIRGVGSTLVEMSPNTTTRF